MRLGFLPGDELLLPTTEDVLYEVQVCLPSIQGVKVLDKKQKAEVILDEPDLRQQIAWGKLCVRRRGVLLTAPKTKRSIEEDAETLAALRVLSALDNLRKQRELSRNAAYVELRRQFLAGQTPGIASLPSRSHVYRLWNLQANGLPIRKGNAAKGNREPKHSAGVRKAVADCAGLYLQTHSRWSLPAITNYINLQLRATPPESSDSGAAQEVRRVSKKYVRRVIHEDLHTDPEHARMPAKDAIGAKAVASRIIRVEGLFERVEQDALHLPWLLRTPYGDSTDVYLVHAIDCCTSVPAGWHLVIGSP